MGSSDSHTQRIIQYKTDPAIMQMIKQNSQQTKILIKLVQKLQRDYQEAKIQAKKLKDPAKYQELKQQAFHAFLDNITKLKFTQKIPKIDGHKHHVLIGNISSGKTSLINRACKLNLPVGLGQCTSEVKEVAKSQSGKIHIWDCPGINEHFSLFEPQNLSYFFSADRIFLLYPQSPKNCKQILLILNKIKPNEGLYLVRTKCDQWDPTHAKTIQQQVESDKKLIKKWKIQNPITILCTSSKKGLQFQENQLFDDLLKGKK